jgi:uncharacterized SAM-binding protein YcdF (DUF218 family)
MLDYLKGPKRPEEETSVQGGDPIEPERLKITRANLLKWLFFLLVVLYMLSSYFRVPILTRLGQFLVVADVPQKSDLIVCLAGGNIERGLATADLYKRGLAPSVFLTSVEPPDGYGLLKERGLHYPENVDLLLMVLRGLGVPDAALLKGHRRIASTYDEAVLVKALVEKRGYGSIILVTSPPHSRRAWMTFKRVLREADCRIFMVPTPYSGFNPTDWWKKPKYFRQVVLEYQKLFFYLLRYWT